MTTALGCILVGTAFVLIGSHTLHVMAEFLYGCAVGSTAAFLNIQIQRRVKHSRRPDNR